MTTRIQQYLQEDEESRKVFTEFSNPNKCAAVQRLSKREIKALFWENQGETIPQDTEEWDFNTYVNYMRSYMNESVKQRGELRREYNFAKGRDNGRLYVKHGKGLQAMQNKLRNYISGEFYYDVDLVNCHPRILLTLAHEHHVQTSKLQEYVKDRTQILDDNNLTKEDILIALYKDYNAQLKVKKNNAWYTAFLVELDLIKDALTEKLGLQSIKTSNTKNPKSSRLAYHIGCIENNIIQYGMRYFGGHAQVPMFDGFMVNKSIGNDFEQQMALLNAAVKKRYGELIEFDVKPTESTVQLDEVEKLPEEYSVIKPIFELDHFITKSPYAYWKRSMTIDQNYTFRQLTLTDFKTAAQEYRILVQDQQGKIRDTCIYDTWIKDSKKRCYETVDFIPYNKLNSVPSTIWNTFEGFATNIEFEDIEDEHEPRDISNFIRLVETLCDNDEPVYTYLMKFLAHLVQYPNQRTTKIIVIKSWTGVGKDTLINTMAKILGEEYVGATADLNEVFGTFNVLLKNKLILTLNEMQGKDGIKFQENLKDLSTKSHILVNEKHMKQQKQSNFCRVFIMSNNDTPVNIQVNDRRYVVITSGFDLVINQRDEKKREENTNFWNKYHMDLNNVQWRRSVYLHLNNLDLTGFTPEKPPKTKAHDIMREKNISPLFYFLDLCFSPQHNVPSYMLPHPTKANTWLCTQSDFYKQFKLWYEEKYETQLLYKRDQVKLKLSDLKKACKLDVSVRYTPKLSDKTVVRKFILFDRLLVNEFLSNHIFMNNPNEVKLYLDLGNVSFAEDKKKTKLFSTDCL
jgi:hypothetical protein